MRRILIDKARRKQRMKRGGGRKRSDIDDIDIATEGLSYDLIALDEALEKLATKDRVKADLVKLRYFAGLTGKQAANVLGISHSTADEHWAYVRAWLRLEITKGDETPPG